MTARRAALVFVAASLLAAWFVHTRFRSDLARATARAAQGSTVIDTRCGPIEFQQAGHGMPLLVVHGSGGGHDQGMAFARALTQHGIRVIAPSRFGYLRTPRPADASPQAQADAHVCLLDALGIPKAAVLGASAGAPSALQAALRHPDRISALVLVAPIAYHPDAAATPLPVAADATLVRLLGSDFLFWAGLHVARDAVFRWVLATPPERVHAATQAEQARVNTMADAILPVSLRAAGLRDDTGLGRRLGPAPLESLRLPTLVISARDDGFGTDAGARYTASRVRGAKFIGFDSGGHVWVGHDDEVRAAIVALLKAPAP